MKRRLAVLTLATLLTGGVAYAQTTTAPPTTTHQDPTIVTGPSIPATSHPDLVVPTTAPTIPVVQEPLVRTG